MLPFVLFSSFEIHQRRVPLFDFGIDDSDLLAEKRWLFLNSVICVYPGCGVLQKTHGEFNFISNNLNE